MGVLPPLVKKWSRETLICHDVETQLSTCFLKVSFLPPIVYYLGIQPTQTGSLKNELGCFTLLHNFHTNVLMFMLHVLILLIDYYVLIPCCHLSCPGTTSLLMHKHVRNLTDLFITGFSFF